MSLHYQFGLSGERSDSIAILAAAPAPWRQQITRWVAISAASARSAAKAPSAQLAVYISDQQL